MRVASRAAFAQAAAAMTASDGPSIVSGSDPAVGATGLAAVDLFADDLPRWPEVFPDDVLHLLLLGLSAFVEKAGTGGGLFRKSAGQRRARHCPADRRPCGHSGVRQCPSLRRDLVAGRVPGAQRRGAGPRACP
ncbi:DUF4872 domain-containing protein [Nocardioides convexus]|uniref:DUF4872 domain-containing protein n=1 Tax=Nocardioides convexus TaxID=2712224 RepID=UPI0024184D62|nr:DUF4872 domain-containing protein [Nocardioides convexus]